MKTIAIIEDDQPIGDLLEEALGQAGYATLRAYSGTEAQYLLERAKPDLILLDLMLPGLTGEELLPCLGEIPVIVVSAKVGVDDKVNALLTGAAVTVGGVPVHLTRTEYALCHLLLQNPGRVLSKSAILERISRDTPDCTEGSLKQHMSNLRKKLRAAGGREYIEAVWGIGFQWKKES